MGRPKKITTDSEELLVEEPVEVPILHDLSNFSSCFRCGAELGTNFRDSNTPVRLTVVQNEKLCQRCINNF